VIFSVNLAIRRRFSLGWKVTGNLEFGCSENIAISTLDVPSY